MRIENSKAFGEIVRTCRKNQGLTQTRLAAMANTSARFIGELEKGKPTLQLDKALKIAWLLGIKIEMQENG